MQLLSISIFGLFLTGCGRDEPRADLVIVNYVEPESLDPALLTGVAEMRIVNAMFEGLTRQDPHTGSASPGIAERWDISPDGRVYTFHIRSNLVWSTGEPIDAIDVVYSWIRTLDPATASDYAGQLFYIKNAEDFTAGKIKDPSLVGVRALDPLTLRVELNQPTAFWLDVCALPALAVVPRHAITKYGDRWLMARPLPSSGPYEMIAWRINDKVRLRKNPRYWDAANTKTELIDLLPISSPTTALNLYETGGADIVWDKDLVPNELVDVLKSRPDFHSYPYLGSYFIRFNVTRKPFDDPRVRQALGLVVDRPRITRKITRAGEIPTDHFTPDGVARYHPPTGLGYDPEKARKLLAAAGYAGGKGFPRFQYLYNAASGGAAQVHEKIAVELQQMWHDELGIDVELHPAEWKVYLANQSKMDFEVCRASWIGDFNDPATFLDIFLSNNGNNRTGWKSARYDELVRAADCEIDLTKREKLFQEAETLLVRDENPIIPLYFYVGFSYYDGTKIKGIYQNILDNHPLNAIWKERSSTATRAMAK